MAFKLTREEQTQLDQLKGSVGEAYENLLSVVDDYNEVTSGPRISVEEELTVYNTKLAELKSFVDNIAAMKRDEWDEKSESWQNGDSGNTAEEWVCAWENADLEEVKLDYPEELSVDFENAEEIDLPSEP